MKMLKIHPPVFLPSAGVILLFVILGSVFPDGMSAVFGELQNLIVTRFGWFYILSVAFFLIFVIWLFFSSYGSVKLGKDDDDPDYSYVTWFAMLFSAGMGIGLLFYSVAEPILHFASPRVAQPDTVDAAREAMKITFLHWGLHAWAIYIVIGLSLAYFSYRHNLPLTIRSTLYPLLGRGINGPLGNAVEVLAVFGTLFGVATSLGLGVMQINAGLGYLNVMQVSTAHQLMLIAVITLIATTSVVTGLDKGVRRLSEFNMIIGLLLLLFVFFAGPTEFLLKSLVQSIGAYLQNLPELSFHTDAYRGISWEKSWTMFYWGWWISWSPFVGMFIARISRGRTIREFIGGVLLVPTLLTCLWMVVFGDTAIHIELFGSGGIAQAVSDNLSTALFVMLDRLPWSSITSGLATLVIATFFITSSDSASMVIDILTSGGDPNPPVATRIFWALTEGGVAAILLLTGGLVALQTAAITTALPFCVIMLVICWSLVRGLRVDKAREERRRVRAEGPLAFATAGAGPEPEEGPGEEGGNWREIIRNMLETRERFRAHPEAALANSAGQISEFLEHTVVPAFKELRRELRSHGREVTLERSARQAAIIVSHDHEEDFYYGIRCHAYHRMSFAFPEFAGDDDTRFYTAEVLLRSGKRARRELTEFTRDGIIQDFLNEYSKWMGW